MFLFNVYTQIVILKTQRLCECVISVMRPEQTPSCKSYFNRQKTVCIYLCFFKFYYILLFDRFVSYFKDKMIVSILFWSFFCCFFFFFLIKHSTLSKKTKIHLTSWLHEFLGSSFFKDQQVLLQWQDTTQHCGAWTRLHLEVWRVIAAHSTQTGSSHHNPVILETPQRFSTAWNTLLTDQTDHSSSEELFDLLLLPVH